MIRLILNWRYRVHAVGEYLAEMREDFQAIMKHRAGTEENQSLIEQLDNKERVRK